MPKRKSKRKQPKRAPTPARRCIFCGDHPVTGEHLWSQWMHDLFKGALPRQSRRQAAGAVFIGISAKEPAHAQVAFWVTSAPRPPPASPFPAPSTPQPLSPSAPLLPQFFPCVLQRHSNSFISSKALRLGLSTGCQVRPVDEPSKLSSPPRAWAWVEVSSILPGPDQAAYLPPRRLPLRRGRRKTGLRGENPGQSATPKGRLDEARSLRRRCRCLMGRTRT